MVDSQGKVYLLDFDGMQILNHRSLILLYFYLVFKVDLSQIENTKRGNDCLEKWCHFINLMDDDIKHNLSKMFDSKKEEDYLGESVFRLADSYTLQ